MPYKSTEDEAAYCEKIEHDLHSVHGERIRKKFYNKKH